MDGHWACSFLDLVSACFFKVSVLPLGIRVQFCADVMGEALTGVEITMMRDIAIAQRRSYVNRRPASYVHKPDLSDICVGAISTLGVIHSAVRPSTYAPTSLSKALQRA